MQLCMRITIIYFSYCIYLTCMMLYLRQFKLSDIMVTVMLRTMSETLTAHNKMYITGHGT